MFTFKKNNDQRFLLLDFEETQKLAVEEKMKLSEVALIMYTILICIVGIDKPIDTLIYLSFILTFNYAK